MALSPITLKPPKIGDLRGRAKIYLRQDLPAGDYGVSETLTLVETRWAKREPVGSSTYIGSVQVGDIITHRIYLRSMDGLGTSHVIDLDGARHKVQRVTDLKGWGVWTVLEVMELGPIPS